MLELILKNLMQTPVEVFQIVPDRMAGMNIDEIRRQQIFVGNQPAELSEVFEVSGDASDLHHVWHGDLSNVGGIGHRMSRGRIQIQGPAGNHTGSRMTGGVIQVAADTGNHTGAEMTGGLIHVHGSAGSSVGAAYDGGQSGQNGGTILIEGSARNLVGKSMRRGLIAIGGDVKNCCGFAMKAGTIIVFGQAQKNLGLEMTRGTLVIGQPSQQPGDGFVAAGRHPMIVTRLLNKHLANSGFSRSFGSDIFHVFHGDLLRGGRGELLISA